MPSAKYAGGGGCDGGGNAIKLARFKNTRRNTTILEHSQKAEKVLVFVTNSYSKAWGPNVSYFILSNDGTREHQSPERLSQKDGNISNVILLYFSFIIKAIRCTENYKALLIFKIKF